MKREDSLEEELPDQHCGCLMRFVDDFLLIITDLQAAKNFITAMHGGFEEYGILVNANKTKSSFPMDGDGSDMIYGMYTNTHCSSKTLMMINPLKCCRICVLCLSSLVSDAWFPWCGLLIHAKTLEVVIDFYRYAGKCMHPKSHFGRLKPNLRPYCFF
jgi:hypothetical protein